jgi:hypothetical protein
MRRSDSSIACWASSDLTDRGVLRQQHAVPAPEVGHVPHQQHRAEGFTRLEQRDGADQDRDVAPFDLLGDGQARAQGGVDRILVEPDLGQLLPRRVGVNAHPMQRADRVGAREPDLRFAVEDDDAVGDAGRVLELDLVAREGEAAFGDHACEALEHLGVLAFE